MFQSVLQLHNRLASKPGSRWLFSRLICLKAPYFASIAPRIESLEPVAASPRCGTGAA